MERGKPYVAFDNGFMFIIRARRQLIACGVPYLPLVPTRAAVSHKWRRRSRRCHFCAAASRKEPLTLRSEPPRLTARRSAGPCSRRKSRSQRRPDGEGPNPTATTATTTAHGKANQSPAHSHPPDSTGDPPLYRCSDKVWRRNQFQHALTTLRKKRSI